MVGGYLDMIGYNVPEVEKCTLILPESILEKSTDFLLAFEIISSFSEA
jgi:hypothetical protein